MHRNYSLDIARGISIFLIVLSHVGISWSFLFDFFYVQMFFFLSGVFLKPTATFENSLYKKTRSLLYPYVFFGSICSALVLITGRTSFSELHIYDPDSFDNGPQWFLIALFTLTFLYILINQIRNKWWRFVTIISVFCFSYYMGRLGVDDFTHFTKAGISLPFIFLGNYYLQSEALLRKYKYYFMILGISLCAISICFFHVKIGIRWIELPYNPLVYIFSSLGGILFLLSFSYILETCKYLNHLFSWWGIYSLFILCMHWPLVRILFDKILPEQMKGDVGSFLFSIFICSMVAFVGSVLKKNLKCIFN